MRRKRSRWHGQQVALVLFLVLLVPLLIALLSWAITLPPLHSILIALLILLVTGGAVFGMIRDLNKTPRKSLRTR